VEPANSPVAFVHHRVELRIRPHAGQGIDHVIRLFIIQMSVFHPKIGDLRGEAPAKTLLDLGGPLLAHFTPAVAVGLVRRGADALIRRQIHGPGEPRVGRLCQIEWVGRRSRKRRKTTIVFRAATPWRDRRPRREPRTSPRGIRP
jgi:hypothetical protein